MHVSVGESVIVERLVIESATKCAKLACIRVRLEIQCNNYGGIGVHQLLIQTAVKTVMSCYHCYHKMKRKYRLLYHRHIKTDFYIIVKTETYEY